MCTTGCVAYTMVLRIISTTGCVSIAECMYDSLAVLHTTGCVSIAEGVYDWLIS